MTETVKRSSFHLSNVKHTEKGGLEVNYQIVESVNEDNFVNDFSLSPDVKKTIHPDLRNALDGLQTMLAEVYGYDVFKDVVSNANFQADKAQKVLVDKAVANALKKYSVNGFTLGGTGIKKTVIIKGMFELANGSKTAINTHKIIYDNPDLDGYGFEEELKETIDLITNEVYNYVFNGKMSQQALFGAESDPIQEDAESESSKENKLKKVG